MTNWTLSLAAAVVLTAAAPLAAQSDSVFVAADNVNCRADPSLDSPVATRLRIGDVAERLDASAEWVRLALTAEPCWVAESFLVPYRATRRSEALVDAADRMRGRVRRPAAEDFASLGRLVEAQIEVDGDNDSPMLELTLLRLLDAAGVPGQGTTAWLDGYANIMQFFEPAERWEVRREAYQALYERYRDDPTSDQLAWEYLRRAGSDECGDNPNCWIGQIERSVMEYWVLFPDGPYVDEALRRAERLLDIAEDYACWTGRDDYTVVPQSTIGRIQTSLEPVSSSGREQVLALLDEIGAACS